MFEQKQSKGSNLTSLNMPNTKSGYTDRRLRKKGSIKQLIRTAIKENKGRFTHKSLPMKYYSKSRERENRHGDSNSDTEDGLKKLIVTVFVQNSIDYARKKSQKNYLPDSVINDLFPRDPYPVRYNDPINDKPDHSKDDLSNDYQLNSSIQETIYEPTDIYGEPSGFNDNNWNETY